MVPNQTQKQTKLTMEDVVGIKFAHDALLKERYAPGPDRVRAKVLQECPPFLLKRVAIRGVPIKLKDGKAPGDIMRPYGANKGPSRAARTPEQIAKMEFAGLRN